MKFYQKMCNSVYWLCLVLWISALVSAGVTAAFSFTTLPDLGISLEEDIGLQWLFTLRGERSAPQDVVIITTDRKSAFDLGVPQETWKWPRALHAQLVKELTNRGATAIAQWIGQAQLAEATAKRAFR